MCIPFRQISRKELGNWNILMCCVMFSNTELNCCESGFWVGIFVIAGLVILLGVYTTLFVGGVTKESVIYHLEAKNVMGICDRNPSDDARI